MKRKIKYRVNEKTVERDISYIPARYIIALMITVLEIIAVIATVVVLCIFIPYFYIAAWLTQIGCVIKIIASDDNPDYKVPWLLFVLILPVAGFMLYFLFSSRKVSKKYIKRLEALKCMECSKDDREEFLALKNENAVAHNQAKMLCDIANTHLYRVGEQEYFSVGEEMFSRMLADLENAEKFIYMEYFIIEEGKFWNSILSVLKEKAKAGVEVKVVFDDIGCMSTLPGNYAKILGEYGIEATPFSRLRGSIDGEFNNRSHRKILVIDGYIGYTGGVNIADEYINEVERFGHWKDTGVRIVGEAVRELTYLFLVDFGINTKDIPDTCHELYPNLQFENKEGYVIPFGDGPRPIYEFGVGKSVIQNMLAAATEYAYMTSPYLVIDNDLCQSIENAALRGVDVRIILPHIPDKKMVFGMTRSFYNRLMRAGVRIYEYEPGFIHAKSYVVDGKYAMIGTINLDYRSLVHHFENGLWLYKCECIEMLKKDIDNTLAKSIEIEPSMLKVGVFKRFFRALLRIFAPLM